MAKLTKKQEVFVREYLVDLNATQAAIRAGYSAATARFIAGELMDKPHVAQAIKEALEKRAVRTEITADRVLKEWASLAFYDPAEIASVEIAGSEDIAKLPEKVRRAIVGWCYDRNQNFTLKLASKLAALEQVAKHLGMFVERHEHSGAIDARIVLVPPKDPVEPPQVRRLVKDDDGD